MIIIYNNVVDKIKEEKVIAILRDISIEKFEIVLKILKDERIKILEIALNSNNVEEQFDILNSKFKNDFIVGAGTVLTEQDVDFIINKGVKFFLTPNVNEKVLKKAEKNNILCICGFFTASEAIVAKQYDCCRILKLFPASEMPITYLKSLKGPIKDLECIAVGGINTINAKQFLDAGFCGIGIGSSLVNNKLINEGNFEMIRKNIISLKRVLNKE